MRKTFKAWWIMAMAWLFVNTSQGQSRITKEEYIEKYKKIAVEEMKRSGIPASITLAQGILESGNGNSTLARKANNHFGIKCHNWDGEKHYHDDDAKDECFRKYDSAEESYRDHTDFLMKTPRYRFLFEYRSDDYKSWAHGLQKAGYATSKTYASDLIRTIEENKLYIFDSGDYTRKVNLNRKDSDEDFTISLKKRKIYERNRIKYIIAQEGDNLVSLTKELDLFSWQLRKYNDLPEGYEVRPGEILYIQPKRNRAEVGYDFHIVKEGETMHAISQLYGIKLRKLYRRNHMEPGTEPVVGQKLWLRKTMPRSEMSHTNTLGDK
ncbi:MAG TPA: glucosaminidase domain-containing protein [Bacteroidales bacterium]|nr:glucosaminidase domain-containing protein [Bacteroidales bacterium]HOK98208.1 glucosaminidase domain-containing protein [Bacteroidales bacterium]HPO65001.1 glucosaminidase domain-containing protein [Bacteroidales bacterium]